MSNQSTFSTLTIGLIIVGLVIGAGGGYFIASSSFQPRIREMESQVTAMTSQNNELSAQVDILEEDNVDLEAFESTINVRMTVLESQISNLNSQVSSLESDLEDAQDTISQRDEAIIALETSISEKDDIIEVNEAAISVLESTIIAYESQIESLEAQLESFNVTPGFNRYSLYDFYFEYPEAWSVSLSGMFESEATDNSGMITISHPTEEAAYAMGYIYSMVTIDPDDVINGNIGVYEIDSIEPRTSGTLNGHVIRYQILSFIVEGEVYYSVWSAWYCDVNYRLFNIGYVSTENNAMEQLSPLLSSHYCHT